MSLYQRAAPAQEIERTGARPGDWAWLSDGEVIVGAQLAVGDRNGMVGVPDCDTLVHLDEERAAPTISTASAARYPHSAYRAERAHLTFSLN